MRKRALATMIAAFVFAASSQASVATAKSGMMIGCVFGMKGDNPTKRTGFAIFLPETGSGRHALSSDQVFDPDNLLNEGGFDTINVGNGASELTGKNRMSLRFLGGEIYEGTLNGNTSPASAAWCVVSQPAEEKSGFADFAQILAQLRRPSSENVGSRQ